jgi:hypothetical protein
LICDEKDTEIHVKKDFIWEYAQKSRKSYSYYEIFLRILPMKIDDDNRMEKQYIPIEQRISLIVFSLIRRPL